MKQIKRIIFVLMIVIAAALTACGGSGGGGGGGGDGDAIEIPSNVTATAGNQQVTLSWDSASGAQSYNVYWSTSNTVSPESVNKISGIVSGGIVHDGLTNGTPYYYVVTTITVDGESDASDMVSATPSNNPPPPPV